MIRKLTTEQLATLKKKQLGKKHPARTAIEQMLPGEAIEITRNSFSWKNQTPRLFTNTISKKTNSRFVVSVLLNNAGWVVERVADAVGRKE